MANINNENHEVIVVSVNTGFTDAVMDAAKKCGAKGGTILSARASAYEKAEKDYGVPITPDKELIFILVDAKIKDKVMTAIYKAAGIETKAMAIICSLPANNVVGLAEAGKKASKKK